MNAKTPSEVIVIGAGIAVGVAALLEGLMPAPGAKTAVVLSGANVDMDDFMAIVTGSAGLGSVIET